MLFQGTAPRPVIKLHSFPESLVVILLEREGTSTGLLRASLTNDFDWNATDIPTKRVLPLDIPGFRVKEYVVTFEDLLTKGVFDQMRGVTFQARSAVRLNAAEYEERVHTFTFLPLPEGGGAVQIGAFDFSNPHFRIKGSVPPIQDQEDLWDPLVNRASDRMMILAFNRTHAGGEARMVDAAAKKKAERLASFNLETATRVENEYPAGFEPPEKPVLNHRVTPQLTVPNDPLPRFLRDMGMVLDE